MKKKKNNTEYYKEKRIMEEKIDLQFPTETKTTIENKYSAKENGQNVEKTQIILVDSYLDITRKSRILDAYFAEKESTGVTAYLESDMNLILNVLAQMTNIEIEKHLSEDEVTGFVDSLLKSGVWYKVKSAIINFAELSRDIEKIYQQRNLENKVNAVADKILLLLDNVSKLDFSKEGFEKLTKDFSEAREKILEYYPENNKNLSKSVKKSKKSVDSEESGT
jgi:hypothetical protein